MVFDFVHVLFNYYHYPKLFLIFLEINSKKVRSISDEVKAIAI